MGVMEFIVAAGVVAATIGGWMKLVRPCYHGIRGGVRNVQAGLALLDAQLNPNGGGSLIDKVNAYGKEQKAQGVLLQQHGEVLIDIKGRLEKLETQK